MHIHLDVLRPSSTLCARLFLRRDRLYGEILKKKKEMLRLIKEKEAQWAARHGGGATAAGASGSGRSTGRHTSGGDPSAGRDSGRQSVQGQYAGRKSGGGGGQA